MLNLKKLFSKAGKTYKVAKITHFQKDTFFLKNDTIAVFRIFRPKGDIC
jgi:hypothetical protein